jgi:RluA family pseudouridine synthase
MNPETKKSFTSERYQAIHPVKPEHEGLRLDAFVHLHMPTLSREFLKSKISSGDVIISGRTPPHKPSVKVHEGETITINTYFSPYLEDEHWYGQPIELKDEPITVFEDQDLIVCMKPPFMITHPAGRHLFYCATVYYGSKLNQLVHSIHRLDRETSGLLLLGKNPRTANLMAKQFELDQIKKCYFFIAKKNSDATPFPFIATEPMERDETKIPRGMMWINQDGKEASTRFELLHDFGTHILGLAFPQTGRQHQIRVHAAHHGYPLLGDKMYNGDPGVFIRFKDGNPSEDDHLKMEIPRHALHAVALKCDYPSGQTKIFISPLPKDLRQWIEEKEKGFAEILQKKIETILSDF